MTKHCIDRLAPALAAAAVLVAGLALANDPAPKPDPKVEEMLKKAREAGTPGTAHKVLEPLVGEWDAEVKAWMSPGAPPTVSKGTARSIWVLNGRFVQQDFNGEFMGTPFHGISFTGYDNVRQKYRSVWMDDMSTTTAISEGDADPAGEVITFGGSYACAMTGEKDKAMKQVYRILGSDRHVFEMYDPATNQKTMEITYTRK